MYKRQVIEEREAFEPPCGVNLPAISYFFELDFVFSPYYFEQDEEWGKAHIVTDFIRDVQTLITRIGNEKGRHIPFGARIMPTVESNTRAGLDVRTWLREELLDFVVPAVYGPRQMDVNMPFEWLVE